MSGKLVPYFSKTHSQLLDSLNSPEKIQEFIDKHITYDPYRENRSVREVLEDGKGECYNGALLACACLINAGIKASMIELLAKEDEEHILCVYEVDGNYGSIAQSKFLGLKSRKPIYKTVHDLAVSYKEFYFAFDGRYSLMSYTNIIDLDLYNLRWLVDGETVIKMGKDIRDSEHFSIGNYDGEDYYVSPDRYWREVLFIPEEVVIPEEYLLKRPTAK